jgi:hypothetical protein
MHNFGVMAQELQNGESRFLSPCDFKTLHEPIVIQVTVFQRLKAYMASASGMVVAAAALVTPLAVLIGLIPKVRKFFKDELASYRRRRARRT